MKEMAPHSPADQKLIGKLRDIVIANIEDENFGVKELARSSGMTMYNLGRRLHSVENKTVIRFIREIRLQKALEMLQNEEYTASEIGYKVGFSSPNYFNKCFHDYFGFPPGKVRKGGIEIAETGKSGSKFFFRTWPGIFFGFIIIAAVILFTLREIRVRNDRNSLQRPDGSISIAVLPFRNLTNDSTWNIWQDGIQSCLVTKLTNTPGLLVRQTETVNGYIRSRKITDYASVNGPLGREISRTLDAGAILTGTISQAGHTVRLNAQMTNARTQEPVASFLIDGDADSILKMTDQLGIKIKDALTISGLKSKVRSDLLDRSTLASNSPEAYRLFLLGNKSFYDNDFPSAVSYFQRALKIDSTLYIALAKLSGSYYNMPRFDSSKVWAMEYYNCKPVLGMNQRIWADYLYAINFLHPQDVLKSLEELKQLDDQNPLVFFNMGDAYLQEEEYDKAIAEFRKALDIFRKRGTAPFWGAFYYELGIAYHKKGMLREEEKLYRKADRDFPGDPGLLDQHAWLELSLGDTVAAGRYLDEWAAVRRKESWSEAAIASYLAYVYTMAGDTVNIERSLRRALELDPSNTARMSSLSGFLIEYEVNIDEGLALAEQALQINPSGINTLEHKGWGLYKKREYRQALDILEKSWELRMEKSVYNHKAFMHLDEVRKAASERTF